MPTVVIDARDALQPAPARMGALHARARRGARARAPRAGVDLLVARATAEPGPSSLSSRSSCRARPARSGAAAVHSPNCFLPLRRPCPGVVTVHDLAFEAYPDDFAPAPAGSTARSPRAPPLRGTRDLPLRVTRATTLVRPLRRRRRRGPDDRARPRRCRRGDEQPPPGPYLLAVGDLRAEEEPRRLVEAFRVLHAAGSRTGSCSRARMAARATGSAPPPATRRRADRLRRRRRASTR